MWRVYLKWLDDDEVVRQTFQYAMFARSIICDQRELTTGKYGQSFAQ